MFRIAIYGIDCFSCILFNGLLIFCMVVTINRTIETILIRKIGKWIQNPIHAVINGTAYVFFGVSIKIFVWLRFDVQFFMLLLRINQIIIEFDWFGGVLCAIQCILLSAAIESGLN